jgi:hypothetical protein
MELRNRDIKYSNVKIAEAYYGTKRDAEVIKSMLGIKEEDNIKEIPAALWDELNKSYRNGVRKNNLNRFFGKVFNFAKKAGLWYVGANVVIAIAIGVAMLAGVDVFTWYTGLLGGRI